MKKSEAAFIISLLAFVLLAGIGKALMDLGIKSEVDTYIMADNYKISIQILEPTTQRVGTAVFIHGILATKYMLRPLATDLVRYGWRVILIDQIGHGGTEGQYAFNYRDLSNTTYALEKALNETKSFREAIGSYLENELPRDEPIVIGGHSLGAFLAIAMAKEYYSTLNIVATVAIAPPYFAGLVNASVPPNLLICVGSKDEFIKPDYVKLYLNSKNPEAVKDGILYGDFRTKTAREVYIANSDHILEPYDSTIISLIIKWIYLSIGKEVRSPIVISPAASIVLLIGLLAGLIMVALIPLVVAPWLGMISGGKRFPTVEQLKHIFISSSVIWPILTVFLLGIFLGAILAVAGETGYVMPILVTGYLFVATLSLIFSTTYLSGKKRDIKKTILRVYLYMKSDVYRGVLLGVIEAIAFIIVLQITLGDIIFSVIPLTFGRWLMVAPSALAIFIYFMFHEYFFRAQIQEILGGRRRSAAFLSMGISTLSKIVVILIIDALILYVSPFKIVALFALLAMFGVTFLTEGLAASSYYSTREILPHALASAVLWATIVTAIFPVVNFIISITSL